MSDKPVTIRNFNIQAKFADSKQSKPLAPCKDMNMDKSINETLIQEIVDRCLSLIEAELEWKNER